MNTNCTPLELEDYRSLVSLNKSFRTSTVFPDEKIKEIAFIKDLLSYLQSELPENHKLSNFNIETSSYKEIREQIYILLTIREPKQFPSWFNSKLDNLLRWESNEHGITNSVDLPRVSQMLPRSSYSAADRVVLWQGDITTIQIDAIVNAANKALLGCFHPFHRCIDNAIHSAAGPRLRKDCNKIIKRQSCLEETGWAKITRGYNLPSKFVLHTVGPIFDKRTPTVSPQQEKELSNCYLSCLNLAQRVPNIRSIAFCSISTGVFGFPIAPAAKIAIRTVDKWLMKNPEPFDFIVFNVFSKSDFTIYENLLR
ncbi:MAG: protein-ADP-ribose hydrolase [Promethearchaeota archaeon]